MKLMTYARITMVVAILAAIGSAFFTGCDSCNKPSDSTSPEIYWRIENLTTPGLSYNLDQKYNVANVLVTAYLNDNLRITAITKGGKSGLKNDEYWNGWAATCESDSNEHTGSNPFEGGNCASSGGTSKMTDDLNGGNTYPLFWEPTLKDNCPGGVDFQYTDFYYACIVTNRGGLTAKGCLTIHAIKP